MRTFVRTRSVQIQALCLIRALCSAAATPFRLMGWDDDEWTTTVRTADGHVLWLFEAVEGALAAEEADLG